MSDAQTQATNLSAAAHTPAAAPANRSAIELFFREVLPWGSGAYVTVHCFSIEPNGTLRPRASRAARDLAEAVSFCRWADAQGWEIYYCVSSQAKPGAGKADKRGRTNYRALRGEANAAEIREFFLDCDVKEGAYATVEAAEAALRAFCMGVGLPLPSIVVRSGGGLHAHWVLDRPVTSTTWKPLAHKLQAACMQHGIKADHGVTVDIARILRVPGTQNRKYGQPREVSMQITGTLVALTTMEAALASFSAAVRVRPSATVMPSQAAAEFIAQFPPRSVPLDPALVAKYLAGVEKQLPLLDEVARGCPFVAATLSSGGLGQPEPLWRAIGQVAMFTEEGLAGFHLLSKDHKSYDPSEVVAKYERIIDDQKKTDIGWPRCASIQVNGSTQCAACPNLPADKSPLNFARGEIDLEATPPSNPGAPSAPEVEAIMQGTTPDEVLLEFNKRYAVVCDEGDTVIYRTRPNPQVWQTAFVPMNFEDLKKLYQNRKVNVGTGEKPRLVSVADVWLDHASRTTYPGGVVYAPPNRVAPPNRRATPSPGTLNLWRGFSVEPVKGSWARLQGHMFENICSGNPQYYEYLFNKLAYAVQNPGRPGEVAVVMKGGNGTGKGTLGNAMAHLFGSHALRISNRNHLTGNFNEHLFARSLMFSDEAFYPGDKAHISILKSIITEEFFMVEGKFKTARQALNCLHLFMASNNDWVVPADMDARRFFVLEVSGQRANDHAYFGKVIDELNAGGYEAMLYDLLHRDLSKFNIREVPQTAALLTQKLHSLEPHVGWWHECLTQGYVFRSKFGQEDHFEQWHPFVSTDLLYASYTEYCRGRKGHTLTRELLGRFLQNFSAPARPQRGVIGEIEEKWDPTGGRVKEKNRPYGYDLGDLTAARARFTAVTKMPIDPGAT